MRGAVAIATAPGVHPTSVGSARVEDQAGSRGVWWHGRRALWVFVSELRSGVESAPQHRRQKEEEEQADSQRKESVAVILYLCKEGTFL